MPLLSRNLKIHFTREKLIPFKSCVLWKTQPKLFQNCGKLNTRQETVFKPSCVQRIVSFCRNCKKIFSKCKHSQRNAFFVKKFEETVLQTKGNSIHISCNVEDANKSTSKLHKVDHQDRNCFQTKFCLENCFFEQELQEKLPLMVNKAKRRKKTALIVQKLENRLPEKQANFIQITCTVEDATKTISKLGKVEHNTRNRFQTKFILESCFFVQEMQETFLSK